MPVAGDWDGNGTTDIAVRRGATWHQRDAATSGPASRTFGFGLSGDLPVPGDYDKDGDTDIAVFRPSVGGWYRSAGPTTFFGLSDLFIVALLVYDLSTRGKVHPATIWGGLLIVASQPVRLMISGTPPWLAFASWLTS